MSFGEYFGALSSLGDAYQSGLDRYELKKNQADASKIYGDQLTGLLGAPGTPAVAPGGGLAPLGTPVAPRSFNLSDASGGAAGDYLSTLRGKESGGNVNAKNPNSTATGIDQFTASTWAGLAKKYPQLGLTPNGRTDEAQSTRAMQQFTADNAKALTAAGVPITPGNLYVSHFLGEAGGPKFIAGAMSNPNAPAAAFVSPGAVAANRSIFLNKDGTPKTAGEVYAERTSRFGGVRAPAPQQVASAAPAGDADMPTPDAVPAEYRIPGGGSAPASSDFTPGTVASPAIGGGNAALPAAAPAGPRVTPQQADQLRRMLANPVTAPQAQAMIAKLSSPQKWETKELGGRVVQMNDAGDIRPVPGFEKPPELTQFKGADGNDYLLNKSTGAITRAVEGKEKGFTDLVNPADRTAAGIPANYAGPVQRGPNNELRFPGAGQNGITTADKIQSAAELKLADKKLEPVTDALDARKPAAERLATLSILADAWKNGDGKITTGPLGEGALKLKQFAKGTLGIETNGLTETELVQKVGTQLAAQASKDLTSRPTQFDFQVFLANNPGINLSPQGNLSLISLMQQKAKHDLQLAQLAQKYKPGDDWEQTVADFDKAHPVISPLTKRPLDPNEVIFPADPAAGGGAGGQGGTAGAPRPPQAAPASMLNDARDAIRRGAPKGDVVREMLKQGYSPAGL